MLVVDYWGGPKDGETIYPPQMPTPEFIMMEESQAIMDVFKFYAEVKDHPLRTQKYHKYVLASSDKKNHYRYIYVGIV